MLLKMLGKLLVNIVFPHHCCHCKRRYSLFCDSCFEYLDYALPHASSECADMAFDTVTTLLELTGPAQSLIHFMKYHPSQEAAQLCGKYLYLYANLPVVEAVTAVPMHPKKRQERGFNQAEVIAQTVAAYLGIPYVQLLQKTRHTSSQAAISSRSARLKHLQGSVAPAPHLLTSLPTSVLLIDDVYTTGATLHECSATLNQLGISTIHAAAIAQK